MTSSPEPFVSVVTPFHNGVEYLQQCTSSVLAQTHRNFEYLLIDNHSADGASELARDIAASDPRVRLIRPPTLLPQDANYSFGLSQISDQSAFVKIVAGDDWLFRPCLSEMVAVAHQNPSIGIVSSYRLRGPNVDGSGIALGRKVVSGRDAARLYLLDGVFLFGSPTTVLYRADLVRAQQPFYADGRLHADTEAAFEILAEHDFGFVDHILSFSRTQANSEMGSRNGFVPEALDRLVTVCRYGRRFLSPDEFDKTYERALRWEYSILARGWLAQRLGGNTDEFWAYHRRGLNSVGLDVDPPQLAIALARAGLRSLVSPIQTAQAVRSTVRSSAARKR